jgi:hypothetical protein
MANKIKFSIKKENFSDLLDKISNLTSIGDILKIKIDSDNINMYSMLGSGGVMLAFKNFLLNTPEYLQTKSEIEGEYSIVIANAGKFVKNLKFLSECEKIDMTLSYKGIAEDRVANARSIQISGGKLKINWMAAESYEIKDIKKEFLEQRLNLRNRKWSFTIDNSDFSDIKKLSNINSEKVINITVDNGLIKVHENAAWEIEIGKTEKDSANLIFNKRFFKCIDDSPTGVEFSMFDTFILIKEKNSNLMLSYEQDFSEE